MKLWIFISLFCISNLGATSLFSQQVSLKLTDANLVEIFQSIQEQTSYQFLYSNEVVDKIAKLDININDGSLDEVLNQCLESTNLEYSISNDGIVLIMEKELENTSIAQAIEVKGKITDEDGKPLPGATIMIEGTLIGTTTDSDGEYSIEVPGKTSLKFSFVGYETQIITVNDKTEIDVVLKESSTDLDEVIVTGYSKVKRSSYTGTAVTVTGKELKKYGNTNIMKSLQVFDPSFKIVQNNEFGSDPNKMPEIQIRGKASFPDISESKVKRSLNMPTFILNGFEVGVERIYDLDINRVASVTILKDAAATAIYGSRASNGVVVVETKTPKTGSLQITYNFSAKISAPDLSDYNLMNAAEKLEAELRAGYYNFDIKGIPNEDYQEKLFEVKKGVNTYWISQPLQVLFDQNHSLSFEGGDESMKYGVFINYDGNNGIMKGAKRDNYSIDFDFLYTYKKIKIINRLSINNVKSSNSNYGDFSQYTQLNPYLRLKDAKERYIALYSDGQVNPLYDASLKNKDERNALSISNNLTFDIPLFPNCRLDISFAFSKYFNNSDRYESPKSSNFLQTKNTFLRGRYSVTNEKSTSIDASAVINYFKVLNKKHVISTVIGCNVMEDVSSSNGFSVIGFASDRHDDISFAKQFEKDTPSGDEETSRLLGVFANLNYDFDDRFFMDASARLDRSSQFGKLQRTAPFWALGIGWNLKNEFFKKNDDIISSLKITANMGTTGDVDIEPYQAFTTYNYSGQKRYAGKYIGAEIMALGNKNLKWQITFNRNIGFLSSFFNDRLQVNINYYFNTTKDLITDIALAPSIGFSSIKSNIGGLENKGIEVNTSFKLIKNEKNSFFVTLFANARHNENKIIKISDHLKMYNDRIKKMLQEESEFNDNKKISAKDLKAINPYFSFKEGESLNAIYAVRSFGIDPVTGQEVFIKKDGKTLTYKWDADDRVVCGNSSADIEGYFGISLTYGKFDLNFSFNYQFGAQIYNSTLLNKIENADLQYNADKRVLEKRWEKPGDISFFRKILGQNDIFTRASSRFVEDENVLALNSISCSYSFSNKIAKKLGMQNLRCSANMNDIFRLSTIKRERGLSYPFARTFSFSIAAYF